MCVCGSPFKTRIVVHDPENVAGFSTSLGASAGSSASGNLPIRSRNRRTSWFPENVEKSFPRSESRLGTPPTPQTFKPFAKRLNVWNVIYRSPRTIDNNFLFRCYFFLRSLSLSLPENKRKWRFESSCRRERIGWRISLSIETSGLRSTFSSARYWSVLGKVSRKFARLFFFTRVSGRVVTWNPLDARLCISVGLFTSQGMKLDVEEVRKRCDIVITILLFFVITMFWVIGKIIKKNIDLNKRVIVN